MAVKPTRMRGQWMPATIAEDHTFSGTLDVTNLVATTVQNSSAKTMSWNGNVTMNEAANVATVTIGTVTHYFNAKGFKYGANKDTVFNEAANIATITVGTVSHYLDFKGFKISTDRTIAFTVAGTIGTITSGTSVFLVTGTAIGT